MIGTILQHRYRLNAELGHGGFGVVYQAHDLLLNRDVAIKLLHNGSEAGASERLLHEARAVAQLSHPNTVNVYDAGILSPTEGLEGKETTFIVMEWVQGKLLSTYLLPLSLEQTLLIAPDLCGSAAYPRAWHRPPRPEA